MVRAIWNWFRIIINVFHFNCGNMFCIAGMGGDGKENVNEPEGQLKTIFTVFIRNFRL